PPPTCPSSLHDALPISDQDMLFDSRISTESERQTVYETVAHEMAHQWFGNLVTMVWWDELWLNEGFATWMSHKVIDRLHPEWKIDRKSTRLNSSHQIIS